MKSIITASLALLTSIFISSAQITINHTDMPVLNDSLRYSITPPLSDPDFLTTGENFVWDYAKLGFQSQEREDYLTLNSINFFLNFAGYSSGALGVKSATILPLDEFDVEQTEFYSVYVNSTTQYKNEGFFINATLPLSLRYSEPDVVYSFPLNFGDSDSTSFSGYRALGDTLSLTREGYRKNEVDGWGEITTPLGTFESLRVKTTLYESDSLFWTSLDAPIVVRRTHIHYTWLAKGQKIPVLEARYFVPDEDTQNPLLTFVRFKDIYREPMPVVDFPVADFHADKTEAFIDEPITLLNNSSPEHIHNTYTWTFEPAEQVNFLNGSNSQSIEPEVSFGAEGSYSVKLLTENISGKDSLTKESYINIIEEGEPTSVFNIHNSNRPVVWLSGKQLHISHSEPIHFYTIYDLAGRIVYRNESDNSEIITLDTEIFSSGTYILQVFEKKYKTNPAHVKFVVP